MPPRAQKKVEEAPAGFEPVEVDEAPPGFEFAETEIAPTGFESVEPEEPSIADRIVGRFLGNDVEDDPLEFTRLGTTITGAVVGASAGAKGGALLGALSGPAAPVAVPVLGTAGLLLGGGIGAFAGAIAPEGFMEAGEELGLLEEGTREREGLSPEELRTVAEGEALLDIATGGGLTFLRGAGRVTATVFTGARKQIAEQAARQGIDMIPVQVGDRVIGRGFVSVFGRFPLLGGGAVRRRAGKAEEQLRDVVTGLAARTGPLTDGSELGVKIFGDAKALVKETNRYFREKYTAIFAQADKLGVRILPDNVLVKADEIIAKIAKQTPREAKGTKTDAGTALEKVRDFIKDEILVLRSSVQGKLRGVHGQTLSPEDLARGDKPAEMIPGVQVRAAQSLSEMDGLISKIDQEIGTLEPGQKRFALALLKQLRQAAQRDVTTNIRGLNADEIGRALRELDTEFSHTMSQLFETATAKRFGSVEKRGLRAVEFDRTTRTPVDQLARIVVNLNSPQAIDELARIISPGTLRRVTSHTLDDAMQMAMKTDGFVGQLDIEVFAKRLGLDGTNEARKRTIGQMLLKSGSEITLSDLDDIVAAGRALAGFDIPNVSSFIARRGAIGGLQSIINGVVPGLALLGGSSAATAYSGSSFVGAILFVGGSHLFARIISNPNSARALHKVFGKEATVVIRRNAVITALRGGLEEMRDLGEITEETFSMLQRAAIQTINAMDQQIKAMAE